MNNQSNSQSENHINIPAQIEQTTQTPNLDDLTKAFAEVSFMWSCILTHDHDNPDTVNSRFKWLSQEAEKLAAVAMQIHTGGEK
ncbi:MAG: hypothetical protein WCP96_18740 [Methylococcaceae bacterium]